ncbi:hypothetical protein NLG97_g11012 [Lecanicillium saksenae]|uniref:Uncharacterized protein n=1 Tax=Lecanicillium saksenae TaxID=468837 RepID=A0ACC1QC35_9HYPO|nr:hypothetical protein NLG97_g11012 [Lecanicillium saksenae]
MGLLRLNVPADGRVSELVDLKGDTLAPTVDRGGGPPTMMGRRVCGRVTGASNQAVLVMEPAAAAELVDEERKPVWRLFGDGWEQILHCRVGLGQDVQKEKRGVIVGRSALPDWIPAAARWTTGDNSLEREGQRRGSIGGFAWQF